MAESQQRNRNDRRAGIALFFFFLFFYMLNASGHPYSADEIAMIETAKSIAASRGFALDPAFGKMLVKQINPLAMKGTEGRYFAKYSPLTSVVLAPAAAVGGFLKLLTPSGAPDYFAVFFATGFVNSFVTALAVATLFFLCLLLGIKRQAAAVTATLFGIAGMALPYAKTSFSEPLTGFLTIACFAAIAAHKKTQSLASLAAAAVFAALLPLARLSAAVTFAPLAVYALTGRGTRKAALALFAGAAAGIAIHGLFNAYRFGSFLETGYGAEGGFSAPILAGLYGLLLSSDKSVFVYSPVLLLFPFGIAAGAKRGFKPEAACIAGIFVVNIFLYSMWHNWGGGHAWGPRFLVAVEPVCMAAAGWVIASLNSNRIKIAAVTALVALALTVQWAATFTKFIPHYENVTVQYEIDDMYSEGRLLKPGAPRFRPMRAQFKAATAHLAYTASHFGEYLHPAPEGYGNLQKSKLVENAPDFWLFLVWAASGVRLRAFAAAASIIIAACALFSLIIGFPAVRDRS